MRVVTAHAGYVTALHVDLVVEGARGRTAEPCFVVALEAQVENGGRISSFAVHDILLAKDELVCRTVRPVRPEAARRTGLIVVVAVRAVDQAADRVERRQEALHLAIVRRVVGLYRMP